MINNDSDFNRWEGISAREIKRLAGDYKDLKSIYSSWEKGILNDKDFVIKARAVFKALDLAISVVSESYALIVNRLEIKEGGPDRL